MSAKLWQLTAAETASAIREREVSCVEVARAHLERLEAANGALNAVTVSLEDSALRAAAAADAVLARGEATGLLHGVPVTIKENVDQAGEATTNGVAAFQGVRADEDAPVVANLIAAGAIPIGRTNTPEFSLRWFTDNPLRGPTRNPWSAGLTPGGSSGGAAAAVAAGIGAVAHGNDLGGSLRYPAYCCGVTSIRPSLGRVPAYNATAPEERPPATQLMSVQGPIARTTADLRVALAAMAAATASDPWWVPASLGGGQAETPVRVAVCEGPEGASVHPAVAGAVAAAARHLEDAGYVVEAVTPPDIAAIARAWRALIGCEIRTMLAPAIREHGSADIHRVMDWFLATCGTHDLGDYMRTLAERTRLARAWATFMEDYPLVLAPVSLEPPMPFNDDLSGPERMQEIMAAQQMQYVVNFLGLPAVAVPTGLADGAPMGVQVIGRRFREDTCLDAAQVIEHAAGPLDAPLREGSAAMS